MATRQQDFELVFEERPGYLYARITARTITIEKSTEYIARIVEHCDKLGLCKVLVERNIRPTLSNIDAYQVVTRVVESVTSELKIAFVEADRNNRSRLEFAASVARSKHMDAAVFETIEKAEKWLLA